MNIKALEDRLSRVENSNTLDNTARINNLCRRLDSLDTGNGNDNSNSNSDDEYYLDLGIEPSRFAYYRQVMIELCTDEHRKRLFECVNDSVTYDELDYYLKANLMVPPEQIYQDKKEPWYFHELSYLQQTRDGNGRFVDMVKDYGCGHWSNKREEGVYFRMPLLFQIWKNRR